MHDKAVARASRPLKYICASSKYKYKAALKLFAALPDVVWLADMIFVTSSTSSASVKKKLARVKLSMGNTQSVFFPRCNSVEKAPRGQRCKNYPRVVNK